MTDEIRRFDPRVRLVFALCLSAMALLFNRLAYLLPMLAVAAAGFGLTAQPERGRGLLSAKRARSLLIFFVMIAVLQSVFSPSGRTLLAIGSVRLLTAGGLRSGAAFLCRMGIVLLAAAVIAAEDRRRTVQGLVQWRLPYELAFMTATALHFIPIFGEELQNSLTALELRGVELKRVPVKKRLRVYTYLFMPMVASAVRRARVMALAMEMRAFRAYPDRTSYLTLRLTRRDYLAMGIFLLVTAALILLYYSGGEKII